MLTTSHLFWSAHARRRPPRGWLVGSVAPDLPAIARVAALALGGRAPRQAFAATYRRSPWREVQLAAHSALAPALLAALGPPAARGLAGGWAGHLAVDALTHHDDAWPPLWPLSRRRWRAPVSYWQVERHARGLLGAELAALALAARRTRHRRLAALAAAVTAGSLARSLRRGSPPCP